ncbi:MAG: FAD binding domain-containing protein [Acuticoccus sp.]
MKAIVCGGSIGGLFCAASLMHAGWEVVVAERSAGDLSGRGAGIVTHPALIAALEAVGAGTEALGVAVTERVAYDVAGARVKTIAMPQVVTSWDRVHQLLRALVPQGRYQPGRRLIAFHETGGAVTARFADGSAEEADLLVGADGFRSAVRALRQPQIASRYAGYVVWRALADEAALSPAFRDAVFGAFAFFVAADTEVVGYPIAGPDNDLRPAHRRYNFVWYAPAGEAALADMLTDGEGTRHTTTIAPPLIRAAVLDAMLADARRRLPAPFLEVLERGERPFFTPIYDHLSPVMGAGRVALAGDAACVARPHVGMGVTKAAGDALALARHLCEGNDVAGALDAYSAERVPAARAAHERAQMLGRLIFDPREAGPAAANRDGRSHPQLDAIMRLTAIDTAAT